VATYYTNDPRRFGSGYASHDPLYEQAPDRAVVLAQTLGDATLAAAGSVAIAATLDQQLGAATLLAEATLEIVVGSPDPGAGSPDPGAVITPATAGSGQIGLRRPKRELVFARDPSLPPLIVRGRMAVTEVADGFAARGLVDDSQAQLEARRRQLILDVIALT
jgi:hypothetical protein